MRLKTGAKDPATGNIIEFRYQMGEIDAAEGKATKEGLKKMAAKKTTQKTRKTAADKAAKKGTAMKTKATEKTQTQTVSASDLAGAAGTTPTLFRRYLRSIKVAGHEAKARYEFTSLESVEVRALVKGFKGWRELQEANRASKAAEKAAAPKQPKASKKTTKKAKGSKKAAKATA